MLSTNSAVALSAGVLSALTVLGIRYRAQHPAPAPRAKRDLPLFWTKKVDFTMHVELREKLFNAMQAVQPSENSAAIIQGGDEETSYCSDREPFFRQESYFHYLFGCREAGFTGVIDLANGNSYLFVPRLDMEYEIWAGKVHPLDVWKERYHVTEAFYTDEIASILEQKGLTKLYRLHGLNTDSGKMTTTTAKFDGIERFTLDDETLHPILMECRAVKTARELDMLRYATQVSSAAHVQVMRQAMPGLYEYQLESIFRHECHFRGGARNLAYTCICGVGDNSATLHYGHAGAPNECLMHDGDMALLDMGCEYHCYASDITCSFPVNGTFTADQRAIYNAVLAAHDAVFAAIKPGVKWTDMHRISHRALTEKLVELGLLVGSVDELLANHISAIFYPHGLGHFIGKDVHDVAGYPKGVERINEPSIRKLRANRVLEAGMCVTVEPGCYFINCLLETALADPKQAKFINTEVLDRFRGTGGVRIESDVIVTDTGMENMTRVPREVEEIEAVMRGEPWEAPAVEEWTP